jgi:hypothetical protein
MKQIYPVHKLESIGEIIYKFGQKYRSFHFPCRSADMNDSQTGRCEIIS